MEKKKQNSVKIGVISLPVCHKKSKIYGVLRARRNILYSQR